VLFALCLLACTSNDPMNAWRLTAPSDQQPVAPGSVTNLPGCATVTVEVSGSNKVTAHFPADSACKTGLVLIPGGAPTYDRPNSGRVTLPIRVLNRSGAGILSPVRVLLGADSAVVLFAPGLALNGKKGLTPLTPDSATNAGAVWLVDTPGITGAAESTGARPLTFVWADGVQQVRLAFTAVAAIADTARPIPPDTMAWPMTGAPLLRSPDDSEVTYYRNLISVEFGDTVSGVTIRSLFAKYGAIIVGGYVADPSGSKGYVLQFPDPGSSMSALDALVGRLQAEPGVEFVGLNTFRAPVVVRGRYPIDSGLALHRASWSGMGTLATRPWIKVRAPLAWGCETGQLGSAPSIGVLDMYFDTIPADIVAGSPPAGPFTLRPNPQQVLPDVNYGPAEAVHGVGIAAILMAKGDNGAGTAGMLWRSRTTLYAMGTHAGLTVNPTAFFSQTMIDAARRGVQVLSVSLAVGSSTDRRDEIRLQRSLQKYLASARDRLFIYALPDNGANHSIAQVAGGKEAGTTNLDVAVAKLLENVKYQHQILVVSGVRYNNTRDPEADFWTGAAGYELTAQSDSIITINASGNAQLRPGVSYAAPFVAGAAGQLLAAQPSLGGADLQRLLVTSAADRGVAATGFPDVVFTLDAYGALEAAARRSGTPLCGNRVWIAGGKVMAERDGGDEVLHDFGRQMDVVFAHHGGRRISLEYYTPYLQETAMAQDASGHWAEVAFAGDSTIPSFSGAALSMFGYSHDHDSTATYRVDAVTYGAGEWSPHAPAVTVPLPALQLAPGSQGACIQDTATTSNGQFTGYDCSAYGEVNREGFLGGGVAWNPIGGTLLAYTAIGYSSTVPTDSMLPCSADSVQGHPRQRCAPVAQPITSERTEVATIDMAKEAVVSVATIPGVTLRSLGVSEDGTGIVTAALTYTGALDNTPTSCGYEYREITDIGATQAARRINVPELCNVWFDDDGGGFSAVRGYASQSGAPVRTMPGAGASYYGALIARLFPQATRPAPALFLHR
jgi:hypothetical protein